MGAVPAEVVNDLPAAVQWLLAAGGIGSIAVLVREGRQVMLDRRHAGEARSAAAVAVDQATDARWTAIVEAQTTALLEPLTAEVARLAAKSRDLEGKVADLENRLDALGRKYRVALGALRTAYSWISAHMPGRTPPAVPAEIAADL